MLAVEEDNKKEVIAATVDWRAGLNHIQPKLNKIKRLNTQTIRNALTINHVMDLQKSLNYCHSDLEQVKQ